MTTSDLELRKQFTNLLLKRQAHMTFEDAVKDFPEAHINSRPPQVGYTFWHLLEHLRFSQWDILDYIRNADYKTSKWPDEYWPALETETDSGGWQATIQAFIDDRQALVDIVQNPKNDLYAQIPEAATGHNILREIFVVAAHNAYHIGELGILRQVMQIW